MTRRNTIVAGAVAAAVILSAVGSWRILRPHHSPSQTLPPPPPQVRAAARAIIAAQLFLPEATPLAGPAIAMQAAAAPAPQPITMPQHRRGGVALLAMIAPMPRLAAASTTPADTHVSADPAPASASARDAEPARASAHTFADDSLPADDGVSRTWVFHAPASDAGTDASPASARGLALSSHPAGSAPANDAMTLAAIAPMPNGSPSTQNGTASTASASALATPAPASFCPIGLVEKDSRERGAVERTCYTADKGGIQLRQGPYVAKFANGHVRVEGSYENGRPSGHWTTYFADGKHAEEGDYVSGKKDGTWTSWSSNGKLNSRGAWKNGAKDGRWVFFDDSGRKSAEGEFRTVDRFDQQQGRWTFFYPDGSKKSEGLFHNGQRDGQWTEWTDDGRVASLDTYHQGVKEMP